MRESRRRPAATGARRRPAREQRHAGQGRTLLRERNRQRRTARGHSLTFTSRAAVLGLTLCAVVLMLAYPTKEYLGQRSAISAAESQQRQLAAEIAGLTEQHADASQPATVEQQARSRLHYVTPGTRNYIQLAPPAAAKPPATRAGHATVPDDPDGSWYGQLWQSDRSAGS